MPTYAILGATGQTGSELVKLLLPTPVHLNIYARSSSRVASELPAVVSADNVTTFIGDLDDTTLLASCLERVDVVFSTVAQNQNEPGCSIAQRTAKSLVQALMSRKDQCPTIVFLSSASVDPRRKSDTLLIHWILYHIYRDLELAIAYLESNPWIPLVIASPGGLVHDVPHSVELVDDTKDGSQLLSYADLAKGMVSMANGGDQWVGKHVGIKVNEGNPIDGNPAALLRYLLPNILATVCPPLWRLGRDYWPT